MKDDELNETELTGLYDDWMKWVEMTLEVLKMNPNRTENEEKLLNDLISATDEERRIMGERFKTSYKRPENLVMPNTKLANLTFDNKSDLSEGGNIRVSATKKKEVIITAKVVSQLDARGIKLTRQLSEQDRCVFDAVCTLFMDGQTTFTAKQVYKTYTGLDRMNPQAIENVEKSLQKMRFTSIDIDWTNHALMNKLDDETAPQKVTVTVGGYLLPLEVIRVDDGDTHQVGYRFIKEPVYLTYSRITGQLVTIPAEMLKLETVNMTPERIAIQHYMMRQIEIMKNPKNKFSNRTMLFETIFEKCGVIEITNRQTKARYVDAVEKILNEWIERKYIKDYEVTTKGKAKIGVEISL